MQSDSPINFFAKQDQWGIFANFYPCKFIQNGITYTTNQNYFQSKKFINSPWQHQIAKASTPDEAFDMGQSREYPLRADWNQMKQVVMLQGLRLKFSQNQELKKRLLSTGDRQIIQHTDHDHYWGDGLGKGKNRLGVLLMELRKQLRQIKNNNN